MSRSLNEQEKRILETLDGALKGFLELPRVHDFEVEEFTHHLHDLERLILCRPMLDEIEMSI